MPELTDERGRSSAGERGIGIAEAEGSTPSDSTILPEALRLHARRLWYVGQRLTFSQWFRLRLGGVWYTDTGEWSWGEE